MNLRNQTADLEAKATLKKLIWLMEAMTEDERLEIMQEVKEHYCEYCGRNHYEDEIPCQCWNDD